MKPLRLHRETIFSINSAVLASAIRGKSVLKVGWEVKEGSSGCRLKVESCKLGKHEFDDLARRLAARWEPRAARCMVKNSQKVYRFFTDLQFGHTKKSVRKLNKVK